MAEKKSDNHMKRLDDRMKVSRMLDELWIGVVALDYLIE